MSPELSRRSILAACTTCAGALSLPLLVSRSSLAVSNLSMSVTGASTTTTDGTISDVIIEGSPSDVTLDWSGLDDTTGITVTVDVRATDTSTNSHLGSGAKSYETVLQNTYSISDTTGSGSVSFPNLFTNVTFPVSIPANHSGMTVSDFEAGTDGGSQTTELEVRFTADATNVSASDSATANVKVSNTDFKLSGTVTHEGSGVGNATVFVVDTANDALETVVTTNSDGTYTANVGESSYHVVAQYTDANGVQHQDSGQPFVDESGAGPYVAGKVTKNGSGVGGATVFIIDASADSVAAVATTDSNGGYAAEVGSGTYHAMVQYKDSNGNKYVDYSKPYVTA